MQGLPCGTDSSRRPLRGPEVGWGGSGHSTAVVEMGGNPAPRSARLRPCHTQAPHLPGLLVIRVNHMAGPFLQVEERRKEDVTFWCLRLLPPTLVSLQFVLTQLRCCPLSRYSSVPLFSQLSWASPCVITNVTVEWPCTLPSAGWAVLPVQTLTLSLTFQLQVDENLCAQGCLPMSSYFLRIDSQRWILEFKNMKTFEDFTAY